MEGRGADDISERIMAENCPQNNIPQILIGQQTPSRNNMKKITSRHSIIRLLKANDKKKILKGTRGKRDVYTGTKKRMTSDFLLKTMQMRRQWTTFLKY